MNIFISGALHGLGACLTKKFLDCGHRVFAGVLSLEDLGELEVIKDHENLTILKLDVSRPKDIQIAKGKIERQIDSLDVVLNVAGVLLNRENYITEDSYQDMEMTFKVNTLGPIYINNIFLDLLKKSQNPTIINISSEVVSIDGVGSKFATYCMSKTALAQYAFIMKQTLEEQGISMRVFAVHPGRMKTKMGAENGEIEPEESAENIYRIAIGEVLPKNEEIYVNYKGESMLGI